MSRRIERYTYSDRLQHWCVAICFLLAALSGLAFFHPSMYPLAYLLGGGTWARILHPFIGVAMFLLFCFLMVKFWRHNRLDGSDRQWLGQWRDVGGNREGRLPEVGRYNAGQKLMFWLMTACLITLLVTGLVFWRPYFADLYSIGLVRLATLLHAFAATVLIIGVVVHVYAAIWVKGSVRAMLRGDVSEAWARKHHRRWLRQMTGE